MSTVVAVLLTVYGVSMLVAAGAGILWLSSARFRHSLIGDRAAR